MLFSSSLARTIHTFSKVEGAVVAFFSRHTNVFVRVFRIGIGSDKLVLANEMGNFFVEKIDVIHVKLHRLADCLHDSHFDYVKTLPTRTLDSFIPLTESAVSKLIGCSPKKSCMKCQHLW